MIKWGNTEVKAVKWGSTNCTKVYWGSTLVFPGTCGYYYGIYDSAVFNTSHSNLVVIDSTRLTKESDNFHFYENYGQTYSNQSLFHIRMAEGIKFGNNQKYKYIRINYTATNFNSLTMCVGVNSGFSSYGMTISNNTKTVINFSVSNTSDWLYIGFSKANTKTNSSDLKIYEIDLRES